MGGDAAAHPGARRGLSIDAAAITAEHFGIEGSATPLPGYDDDNYRIDAASGDVYVLKVSHSDTDRVRFEQAVFDAIRLGTEIDAPATVAPGPVPLAGGRTARLLTWVTGSSFAGAGRPASSAPAVGIAVGRIVQSLTGLGGGPGDEWDLANAAGTIRQKAPAVNDGRRRAIVSRVADMLEATALDALPRQVIHGDLNDDNILLSNGEVTGVIDAGDAVHSIRIAEPAIAAAYVIQGQDDPLSVAGELVEGFVSVVDVTAEEAAALWPLLMGRLADSVVMSASGPRDNPHRLKSEDLAWDLLERFDAGDAEVLEAELATAAGPSRAGGRAVAAEAT